ncbi:hypothetical protein ACFOPN_10175 [Xanthomonas hyacinthi]|uniref:hypothetical protein n=1 Tax=Xanthomonas hyacinthi TaxID=56455 RepID=UPI000ADF1E1B|nr:hypothetical protein [Xanthomonas hyacinthi]
MPSLAQVVHLGVGAGPDLEGGRNLALYANLCDSDDGHGWTVSPSDTFYAQGDFSASMPKPAAARTRCARSGPA